MPSTPALDVDSTLAALARTLDSAGLGAQLGLTTVSAPVDRSAPTSAGHVELSTDARYQPLGGLGAGGMGTVGAVWDRDLMRELALKQLHERLADDGRSLQQFLWEARVTAHLDHPNIVPVHDIGLDARGRLYFTMKRVRGRSLAEVCALLGALEDRRLAALEAGCELELEPGELPVIIELGPRRRRLRLFIEICRAIDYAHDRGVLHRDLKPANVMLGEFGEVVVMDWGLATPIPDRANPTLEQLQPELLRDGADRLLGTPRYMAPELVVGERPSERSDIYALGVMLYELLALRLPHDADSVPALVLQITEGQGTPLAEAAPRVSSSLVAIVERAMAHAPEQRYRSVRELIEDIEAVLDGFTPRAEQVSTLTRVHRYFLSKDNPDTSHLRLLDLDLTGVSGVALGVCVTLLAVGGYGWWPLLMLMISIATIASPMRAYWRVMWRGKRRLHAELERARRERESAPASSQARG